MKPSRTSTPRLLRDGTWTSGSVSAPAEREHKLCDLLLAIIAVGVIAAICIGVI